MGLCSIALHVLDFELPSVRTRTSCRRGPEEEEEVKEDCMAVGCLASEQETICSTMRDLMVMLGEVLMSGGRDGEPNLIRSILLMEVRADGRSTNSAWAIASSSSCLIDHP